MISEKADFCPICGGLLDDDGWHCPKCLPKGGEGPEMVWIVRGIMAEQQDVLYVGSTCEAALDWLKRYIQNQPPYWYSCIEIQRATVDQDRAEPTLAHFYDFNEAGKGIQAATAARAGQPHMCPVCDHCETSQAYQRSHTDPAENE